MPDGALEDQREAVLALLEKGHTALDALYMAAQGHRGDAERLTRELDEAQARAEAAEDSERGYAVENAALRAEVERLRGELEAERATTVALHHDVQVQVAEVARLRAAQPSEELLERARAALADAERFPDDAGIVNVLVYRTRDLLAHFDAPPVPEPALAHLDSKPCAHYGAEWETGNGRSWWAWKREDGETMGQYPGQPCPTCGEPLPEAPERTPLDILAEHEAPAPGSPEWAQTAPLDEVRAWLRERGVLGLNGWTLYLATADGRFEVKLDEAAALRALAAQVGAKEGEGGE